MPAINKLIKKGHSYLLNRAIYTFSFELHIPGCQFCGPRTHLEKRLARSDQDIIRWTWLAVNDIAYSRSNGFTERHAADRIFGVETRKRITAKNLTFREKVTATAVWAAMRAKTKFGMGMKTKMKTKKKTMKKRVFPTAKRYITNFTEVACARILDRWNSWRGESCERQQNCAMSARGAAVMESHGLYLAPYKYKQELYFEPYKRGQDVITKKNAEETLKMSADVTTNIQLTKRVYISYFKSFYALPISGVRRNESSIINLDDARNSGTHWVTYAKRDNHVIYFNSFDNFRPPKELVQYFGNGVTKIEYNRTPYQTYNQSIYGLAIVSAVSPNG